MNIKYFRYMLLLLVVVLFAGIKHAGAQTNGLIAHWTFDDSTAADLSGNQHHGTIMGTPVYRPGKKGAAIDLNGVADYVTVGHSNLLNLGEGKPMSISMWFKIHQADLNRNQMRPLISQANPNGTSADYLLATENRKLVWATGSRSNANAWLTVDEPTEHHLWQHVVVTIQDTMMSDTITAYRKNIYLNNKLVKTVLATEKSAAIENEYLRIGSGYNSLAAESYFYGLVDEIRFYDRAVTVTEVNELYTFGETVGFKEEEKFEQFSIYPNPASHTVSVELPVLQHQAELTIYSLDGKEVAKRTFSPQMHMQVLQISVADLPQGIYQVQLVSGSSISYRKLAVYR